ncbi:hypothetical protein PR202_ga09156 [Eleusine coracana subsp. coracana]|uniref:BHLH domain-containing protein n=1 Tax=Eleusine coracana subsp. coracana TaxID=191504 RepID=A0AAV5C444_ELECO|nr:hypothetical protein QOZ80_1AG0038730 [Eleusine coracana subsp. coracana]GJM92665.1 hypothetical protein PR202_ga09156 [Eleusine coracana subsp. coracana]
MDPYHYQNMHDPRSFPVIHPQPYLIHPAAAGLSDSRGRGGGGRRRAGAKLSTDPQSVAARERRHRISDRFRVLRSLVPGGSKMDTVSMLEQAIHYVKFLKAQVSLHQAALMQHDESCHEFGAAYSGGADEVMMPASNGRGASDEVMQLPVPAHEAANYAAMVAHQLQMLDPWQMSGGHELPPLPPCVFGEETTAPACYSACNLQEEVDLPGSY